MEGQRSTTRAYPEADAARPQRLPALTASRRSPTRPTTMATLLAAGRQDGRDKMSARCKRVVERAGRLAEVWLLLAPVGDDGLATRNRELSPEFGVLPPERRVLRLELPHLLPVPPIHLGEALLEALLHLRHLELEVLQLLADAIEVPLGDGTAVADASLVARDRKDLLDLERADDGRGREGALRALADGRGADAGLDEAAAGGRLGSCSVKLVA